MKPWGFGEVNHGDVAGKEIKMKQKPLEHPQLWGSKEIKTCQRGERLLLASRDVPSGKEG